MPLIAEIPTRAMTGRMAEAIMTDRWQTPLPIPTVDRHDKRWVAASYWRGDVWPEDWDVSFKLRAPSNTTVECEYRDGRVQSLKVIPESRRADIVAPLHQSLRVDPAGCGVCEPPWASPIPRLVANL